MLAGKRFLLHRDTLAVEDIKGQRVAITMRAGDIIKVVSDPRYGENRVTVLWAGRAVTMFAVDVQGRGAELFERSGASALSSA
jgi:hypothetical protein